MRRLLLALLVVALAPTVVHAAAEIQFGGFGEAALQRHVPCLTDEGRAAIQARLRANVAALRSRGLVPEAMEPQAVSFVWPLRPRAGLTDPGVHGISARVDENPAFPNQLLDYNCGARTYDLDSGYNHQGTDIFLWPFYWWKMDHSDVEIVAGAPGTIIGKDDGNADRSCGFSSSNWNAVYIRHFDGTIAWYGHMKKNSLTPKLFGETVEAGEFLGVVGSSGSSTGPHLHFEVYNSTGMLVDPWGGPCNNLGGTSWWAEQRPYNDSAINALRTHWAPPQFLDCPTTESPNEETNFVPGRWCYFAAYYRDQLAGQVTDYVVRDAAGAIVSSWSHSSPEPHYYASYWYWYMTIPSGYAYGTWRFEATFQGVTTTHTFQVQPVTGVVDARGGELALRRVGANPATGPVELELRLPSSGVARVAIFDLQGRRVAGLADGWRSGPAQRVTWQPEETASGPGVYVARLDFGGRRVTEKILIAR